MTAGVHCAHFEMRKLGGACVGVAGPSFDPVAGKRAFESAEGWVMFTSAHRNTWAGKLVHGGSESGWAGHPEQRLKEGDVAVRLPSVHAHHATWLTLACAVQGLLLDLDAATLTVWVNGERKGVMVRPGMTSTLGFQVARLEGPLRWAVDVYASSVASDGSVAIAGPLPPPA